MSVRITQAFVQLLKSLPMRHVWFPGQSFRLCLFLLFSASQSVIADTPTPWPIKEFQVIDGSWFTGPSPDEAIDLLARFLKMNQLRPSSMRLRDDAKREIETFLKQSAGLLEQWGFPPPNELPKFIKPSGAMAYRIYLQPFIFDSASGRTNSGSCFLHTARSPIPFMHRIELNNDEVLKTVTDKNGVPGKQQVTGWGYVTIAHELFHAVYNETGFGRSNLGCNANTWITEGQADAIGWDIARILRPNKVAAQSPAEMWGMRVYSDPLAFRDEEGVFGPVATPKAYHTSSFWRYLAELTAYRQQPVGTSPMPQPGTAPHAVDYSYLAYFLNRSIKGGSPEAELAWLDAMIQQYPPFRRNLRDIYPEFLAAYTGYDAQRSITSATWQYNSFNHWLGTEVGDCQKATLEPGSRTFNTRTKLYSVSGRCFVITLKDFNGDVSVDVQLHTDSKPKLAQLSVGLAGEHRTAPPIVVGINKELSEARSRWSFRLPGNQTSVFVVTNVALPADKTTNQFADLTISVPGHDEWLRYGPDLKQLKAPPSGQGREPSGDSKATRKRWQRASGKIATDGPLTVKARHWSDENEWVLYLSQVPDELQMLGEVNADGGFIGQLTGAGDAMFDGDGSDAGYLASMNQLIANAERAQNREGANIEIHLPDIDYGFSGPINDVRIVVSRPNRNALESLSPHDIDPTQIRNFPPSGSVVIDMFTPEYVSGSFHGDLIDRFDEANISGDHPPGWRAYSPVIRSISGRFWIGSPWVNDDRMILEASTHMLKDLQTDLLERVPEDESDVVNNAIEKSGIRVDASLPVDDTDSSARYSSCDCSCERRAERDDYKRMMADGGLPTPEDIENMDCMIQCVPEWARCK